MNTKQAHCIDCNKYGPVIAKRCQSCYWPHRKKVKAGERKNQPADQQKKAGKQDLTAWYNLKIQMKPFKCENCGAELYESMAINPRTIVCHIVPKRNFEEVQTHLLNAWYGCQTCHGRYDNGRAKEMPILPAILSRFEKFKHLILPENRHRLPDYLKEQY